MVLQGGGAVLLEPPVLGQQPRSDEVLDGVNKAETPFRVQG